MEGSRVKAKWLEDRFPNPLPVDAPDALVQQYARFYLCVISDRHPGIQAIFRDSNRDFSLRPPMTEHRYYLCHIITTFVIYVVTSTLDGTMKL